ncbi:MAG: 4-hydroxy-tetrahydrodipicolinate reductase [Bacteroidales bacterium]|jgi:4-hydroxy-tetrahydrodipicolinate reductase|nr:4-hydroxy-tetrahydrodipicolinate reductase [Bacteroidales bacterium]
MNIALLGYGKMGKTIEKMALQKGHTIVAKIDNEDNWKRLESEVKQADVAIEFSTPQIVVKNIFRCFDLNIPIVVGTTGWNEQKDEVFSYCKHHQKTLFYASNFSIGVNLFFELNKLLAQMMKNYLDYKVHIEETHHLQKLDKPSGTAISLAEDLMPHYPLEISNITSIREGEVFGIHQIRYESAEDTIEIKHEAKSREGFAKGAVCAAEWLIGKTGIYTMSDMLKTNQIDPSFRSG